jgi:pSer/pThr/pTyr-binding forkhead associated (FHA) protein
MTTARPAIVVTGGPLTGRRFDVDGDVVIGRVEGTIVIDDDEISRRHAVVCGAHDGLTIEDLGSTNGTRVNGRRIEKRVELSEGDEIAIGQTTFRVEAAAGASATVVARPRPGADVAPPPPAPSAAEPVQPPRAPFARTSGRRARGIATRDVRAEILTFLALFGTAVALIAYFALR